MTRLQVKSVTVHYGGVRALHELSLEIEGADAIGLVGPPGSGKTTLLRLLAGEIRPARGSVRFNGRRIDSLSPDQAARAGIGYLGQVAQVFPGLSVLENLLVAAAARYPTARAEDLRAHARETLDFLGLARQGEAAAASLDAGQQRLLALGQLRVRDPQLVLLDAPFAGLTPRLAAVVRAYIDGLADQETLLIVSDREAADLLGFTRRLLVLSEGMLVADGERASLVHAAATARSLRGTEWAQGEDRLMARVAPIQRR